MIISITGTPASGKTYVAKKLAKSIGYEYFDLNAFIKKKKLYDSYDRSIRTYDVDTAKLKRLMQELLKDYKSSNKVELLSKGKNTKAFTFEQIVLLLKKYDNKAGNNRQKNGHNILVDSHLSHFLDSDLCIVVTTTLKKLRSRLEKRRYPKSKIKDNMESEIFQICLEEAKDLNQDVIILDNS